VRRTKIVGVYQISDSEALRFEVHLPGDGYPDQLDQARATLARLMHDALADVIAQVHTASDADDD
jgi:hypothetical protein